MKHKLLLFSGVEMYIENIFEHPRSYFWFHEASCCNHEDEEHKQGSSFQAQQYSPSSEDSWIYRILYNQVLHLLAKVAVCHDTVHLFLQEGIQAHT